MGLTGEANETAVYGFYALAIGVALQVASLAGHDSSGVEKARAAAVQSTSSSKTSRRRKARVLTAATLVILVGISIAAGVYLGYTTLAKTANSASATSSLRSVGPVSSISYVSSVSSSPTTLLTAAVAYVTTLKEPGGGRVYLFGINVFGGSPPLHYVATWSDGVVQSADINTFSRTATNTTTVLTYANVTVSSSDGQTVKLVANFTSG